MLLDFVGFLKRVGRDVTLAEFSVMNAREFIIREQATTVSLYTVQAHIDKSG